MKSINRLSITESSVFLYNLYRVEGDDLKGNLVTVGSQQLKYRCANCFDAYASRLAKIQTRNFWTPLASEMRSRKKFKISSGLFQFSH